MVAGAHMLLWLSSWWFIIKSPRVSSVSRSIKDGGQKSTVVFLRPSWSVWPSILKKSRAGNYNQAGAEITAIPIWLHTIAFQQRRVQTVWKKQSLLSATFLMSVLYSTHTHTLGCTCVGRDVWCIVDRRSWKAAVFFIKFTQGVWSGHRPFSYRPSWLWGCLSLLSS